MLAGPDRLAIWTKPCSCIPRTTPGRKWQWSKGQFYPKQAVLTNYFQDHETWQNERLGLGMDYLKQSKLLDSIWCKKIKAMGAVPNLRLWEGLNSLKPSGISTVSAIDAAHCRPQTEPTTELRQVTQHGLRFQRLLTWIFSSAWFTWWKSRLQLSLLKWTMQLL